MKDEKQGIKKYNTRVQKHADKKDFVKIFRSFNGDQADISGFILRATKDFLLIQPELEFQLNGYAIIPIHQFDSLRSGPYEKMYKKILRGEGVFTKDYGFDHDINLTSWQTIFKDLKRLDYHVIVECEALHEPGFMVGPIRRLSKSNVRVQYYSPAGILEEKLSSVTYKDITIVTFGDRYTTTFRKYLSASGNAL